MKNKVTALTLREMKSQGEKIAALTAYDAPTARLLNEEGVDVVLVGDSAANVKLGYDSALPVTVEEMLVLTRAARRGNGRALLVADMPFWSYEHDVKDAVRQAGRLVKEGGAEAVKVEGASSAVLAAVKALTAANVPVMGHVGLTPQAVHRLGGYKVQGKTMDAARELLEDALALERAGAFAIVLEGIPKEISRLITERLHIPTIGIGAGVDCDGQILVFTDLVGLTFGHTAKFVRQYADLKSVITEALKGYADDVTSRRFPADAESYSLPEGIDVTVDEDHAESMPPLGPIN